MRFELGEKVVITLTGQPGRVLGAAYYIDHPNSYLVEHVDGQGNLSKLWFDETDLNTF